MTVDLTKAQRVALAWLLARGGDGVFDRHGVAVARGETAPIMRSNWNALRDRGLVEFYNPAGKGYGRLRTLPGAAELVDRLDREERARKRRRYRRQYS